MAPLHRNVHGQCKASIHRVTSSNTAIDMRMKASLLQNSDLYSLHVMFKLVVIAIIVRNILLAVMLSTLALYLIKVNALTT